MTQNQVKLLLAYLATAGLTAIVIVTAAGLAGKITISKETLGWLGVIATTATTLGIGGASPIGRVWGQLEDRVPKGSLSGPVTLPATTSAATAASAPRPGTTGKPIIPPKA